jgi:hypothetical protein
MTARLADPVFLLVTPVARYRKAKAFVTGQYSAGARI